MTSPASRPPSLADSLIEAVRSSVRPIVTIQITTVLCLIVLKFVWGSSTPAIPVEVIVGLIASFTSTVSVVVGFWFGQRSGRSA